MKQRTFYLKKGEPIQKVIETIQKEDLIQNPEKSLFIIHEGLKSPGRYSAASFCVVQYISRCAPDRMYQSHQSGIRYSDSGRNGAYADDL